MDATRPRRTHDAARQRWYALCRSVRFARHFQFPVHADDLPPHRPRSLFTFNHSHNSASPDALTIPKESELTITIDLTRVGRRMEEG